MFYLIILPVILWQSLFLLIAITWDSFLFYRQLRVRRKTAIEYARTLNLFVLVIGWIIFFLVTPFLPQASEIQMIELMFFSRFVDISTSELQISLAWLFMIVTIVTTVIKFMGMRLLQAILQNFSPAGLNITHHTLDRKPLFTFTSELSIIFLSNILINTSITILLLLKSRY